MSSETVGHQKYYVPEKSSIPIVFAIATFWVQLYRYDGFPSVLPTYHINKKIWKEVILQNKIKRCINK